jgi:hypothetical protein
VCLTSQAHTVTAATPGFGSDEAQIATFNAIGDTLTIVAVEGSWFIKYANSVASVADVA